MRKTLSLLLPIIAVGLIGCATNSPDDESTLNPRANYRQNDPYAEAGMDAAIWSSNPKKTTVLKRVEDAVEK